MTRTCVKCGKKYLVSVIAERDTSEGVCLPCQDDLYHNTKEYRMRDLRERLRVVAERREQGTLWEWTEQQAFVAVTFIDYKMGNIPPF